MIYNKANLYDQQLVAQQGGTERKAIIYLRDKNSLLVTL